MNEIAIFRMKYRKIPKEEFSKVAQKLGVSSGKLQQTDEGVVMQDNKRALAYAQPGSKFGGLLFYIDSTENIAEPSENLIESNKAKSWCDEFTKSHHLVPNVSDKQNMRISFETFAYSTKGMIFDGQERKNKKFATEIASKISINDIPVVGPRAKVRMVFKKTGRPITIHSAVWQDLDVFEQRDLVRAHDVYQVIKEKLSKRKDETRSYDIVNQKLAYFANEYGGGPDLLLPYYFIDVEFADPHAEKLGQMQGPRQKLWIPAYR